MSYPVLVTFDRIEVLLAETAALTCEVVDEVVKKGTKSYILKSKKNQKTKYEYNKERIRDFRYGRGQVEVVLERRSDGTVVMDEFVKSQIAIFSRNLASSLIKQGLQNHVFKLAKQEAMKKTTFMPRQAKAPANEQEKLKKMIAQRAKEAEEQLENLGKAAYNVLQAEASPFIRNYKHKVYGDVIKGVNVKFNWFDHINIIDLFQQLIGDERLEVLCSNMKSSSVKKLNLGGNDISNEGMKILSTTLRSLPNLIDLNLSYNKFTDDGFIEFIREDKYPEQLKVLNIQFNLLENKSAYHFGSLLNSKHRKNNLEALFLGGKVGKKGWGNQYFTILMVALLPQAIIIDNSLRNKGRPLSSKNGKKFLFGKAKEVSGKTYVSIKRGMGSSKGTIDTALEDIKMNDKNIRPFANKKLKTIFIPDFNITHNGIMSIITLILSSKTITSLNISKNAIPETYAKDLLVNSVRISNSVTEIFARQCGLHDSHYRKLEHNVKIFSDKNLDAQSTVNKTAVNGSFDSLGSGSNRGSNSIVQGIYLGSNHSLDSYQLSEIHGFSNNHSSDSLSWSEKVQLAYYAGKALFEGQTVYHNIMTELTTQWKAKKPAKFVGEMYENKLYTAGSNPKRNNILQTILAELDVPIDLLVYDMHKYLSPFDSLLNYIELLKEAKETITGSVPLKIRFDGGIRNYCSDLEIQKLQVYSDSVSNSLQGILLELLRYETRYNRDRNMYYNIIKSFCEKSIYQNSSNGKSAGRFTLPTRFKPKPKPINDNAILMVIEDYHALLLELISSYEKAIGCTYQLKLLHNYLFIDDAIYSFENYNHSQVPYYCTLGYAALFVHYFYVEFPVEKKKSFDEGHLDRIREQLRSAHGEGQLGPTTIIEESNEGIREAAELGGFSRKQGDNVDDPLNVIVGNSMGMIRPRSRSPITTSQSKKREASKREKDTSNSMERKPKRRMYKKSERENEDKQDNKPIVQSQPSGLVSKLRNIFYGGKDK